MHSPLHSSRTSPSSNASPRPRPNDEHDEELEPMVWDVMPGIAGLPSQYDTAPEPRQQKVIHEKTAPPKVQMNTNCPTMTGKIKNQYNARKTIDEALQDCGDDEALKKCVRACVDSEEYKLGKSVLPTCLLGALSEVMGIRSQSKCRFPSCGKVNVRTDRAKEHSRVHIGNHPYKCTRTQADGTIGCGATFLRKHDRNRHDNGADVLTCDDCGAQIQGKGREYNLQRHKSNYCPVRKAAKATEETGESPASTSGGRHQHSALSPQTSDAVNSIPPLNGHASIPMHDGSSSMRVQNGVRDGSPERAPVQNGLSHAIEVGRHGMEGTVVMAGGD